MRDLRLLDKYRLRGERVRRFFGGIGDSGEGAFAVHSPSDWGELYVIASTGLGWDHVSVSRRNRCPNWAEMEHVKRLFFQNDETAMQLHVPPAEHLNLHPYTLHLWRPQQGEIPRPPGELVGTMQPEQSEG